MNLTLKTATEILGMSLTLKMKDLNLRLLHNRYIIDAALRTQPFTCENPILRNRDIP